MGVRGRRARCSDRSLAALPAHPLARLLPAPQQAAKLADAVLKKHKGDQLLRALKGYAVFRCGKADEALQVRAAPAAAAARGGGGGLPGRLVCALAAATHGPGM